MDEIVGIYHADGGLLGELRYVVGKLLGTTHCALCDITHGAVREKSSFRSCRESLELPFRALHLNEQGAGLASFTRGKTPCVVGRKGTQWHLLLGPEALEALNGSVDAFDEALKAALD